MNSDLIAAEEAAHIADKSGLVASYLASYHSVPLPLEPADDPAKRPRLTLLGSLDGASGDQQLRQQQAVVAEALRPLRARSSPRTLFFFEGCTISPREVVDMHFLSQYAQGLSIVVALPLSCRPKGGGAPASPPMDMAKYGGHLEALLPDANHLRDLKHATCYVSQSPFKILDCANKGGGPFDFILAYQLPAARSHRRRMAALLSLGAQAVGIVPEASRVDVLRFRSRELDWE